MTTNAVPKHSEIPAQYTWNAESLYASPQAWEADLPAVTPLIERVAAFQGRLHESPAVLADALDAVDALLMRAGKLYIYANMSFAVDTGDPVAARMMGRAQGMFGQVFAAIAYLDPELIEIGQPALNQWLASEPRLAFLSHYVDNLFRRQQHIRSAEVEEVLGMLADPFSGAQTTATVLADSDLRFAPAVGADGSERPVTSGLFPRLMEDPDRALRRSAWEHYTDAYLAHKNTFNSTVVTSIKQFTFQSRVHRHETTLEASLFQNNIPTSVFFNLIEVFKKNLPTWQRYWRVRRQGLKVDKLYPYDIWAPIAPRPAPIPYEQAIETICAGLAPLGEEYVGILRRGALQERWVDVRPCQGKMGGAFSSGWKGTHPFIMISYDEGLFAQSTLAHELGHSMHSYLTWQNNPLLYSDYSLFVAEVASNFHQAMVRAHLLNTVTDPNYQISIIEEAMSNFHRYFFIMPTLARFELEVHQRIERGEGVTADDMNSLMADLFTEAYGGEMEVDRERVGITWATFVHMYMDYYVYQYATGISAANALSRRILSGTPGAAEDYLRFLKLGGSVYPLDALKVAGIDMTTPAPIEAAFEVLSGLVDRLEKLVG